MKAPHVLVAGCGFVGEQAAILFRDANWKVTALTRSEESAARLRQARGFTALASDLSDPAGLEEIAARIEKPACVIHCASSGRGGAEDYRLVYLEGTRNLLRLFPDARYLFTGSTSVYAQTDGSEVTEESATVPDRETGRILREAEELALEKGGAVLRLAGIYGPGRSVLLRKFLEGRAVIEAGGERLLNQIHRDDAASALFFLATGSHPRGIYNVADDQPLRQVDCYRWMAAHFGRPLPPAGPADLNRKRGWTNKRVSNARLKSLGWRCLFPSFIEAIERDPRLLEGLPV